MPICTASGGRAQRTLSASDGDDGSWSVHGSSGGPVSGGMKQNWGWPARCPFARIPAAGRADGWRRSAFAARTVGDHSRAGQRPGADACCSARPISMRPSAATMSSSCTWARCWLRASRRTSASWPPAERFLAEPPPGQTGPRTPGPVARRSGPGRRRSRRGRVRFVRLPGGHRRETAALAAFGPPPNAEFEDGFMVLLRQASSGAEHESPVRSLSPVRRLRAVKRSSKSTISCGRSGRSPRSTTSASRFGAARSSDCSDPMGRARRRRFACCADCCLPPAAPCESPGSTCTTPAPARQRSATWPRSSRSMASFRCWRTSTFLPVLTACAAAANASASTGRWSNSI